MSVPETGGGCDWCSSLDVRFIGVDAGEVHEPHLVARCGRDPVVHIKLCAGCGGEPWPWDHLIPAIGWSSREPLVTSSAA